MSVTPKFFILRSNFSIWVCEAERQTTGNAPPVALALPSAEEGHDAVADHDRTKLVDFDSSTRSSTFSHSGFERTEPSQASLNGTLLASSMYKPPFTLTRIKDYPWAGMPPFEWEESGLSRALPPPGSSNVRREKAARTHTHSLSVYHHARSNTTQPPPAAARTLYSYPPIEIPDIAIGVLTCCGAGTNA